MIFEIVWYNFIGLKFIIELEFFVLERWFVEDLFEGDWNKNWNVLKNYIICKLYFYIYYGMEIYILVYYNILIYLCILYEY